MLRYWKNILVGVALLAVATWAMAFTALAPGGAEGIAAKTWQLPAQNAGWDIGYNQPGLDIGAPANPWEGYRWNIPVVTYAFDEAFIRFFGQHGIQAVDDAIRILNELPPASRMSDDLTEFPLNTSHLNYEAGQLGLIDLKSVTLGLLLEHMGLADSIRWTYAIRERRALPGNFGLYFITKFNYDPVTLTPSSYVNGTLYTYHILEIPPPLPLSPFADAVEDIPPRLANEPINI